MAIRRQDRSIDRGTRRARRLTPPAAPGVMAGTDEQAPLDDGAATDDQTVARTIVEQSGGDHADPSVTDALEESVSPAALLSTRDLPAPDAGEDTANSEEPTNGEETTSAQEATTGQGVADDAPAEDLTMADSADEPLPEAASHEEPAPSLLPAEIESAIASATSLASHSQPIPSTAFLSEFTAANDMLVTYLRNEGIATIAHWRALSTARTPADAIRIQLGEMQRAADASLTCIASLTRRAGRMAATVRRG